MKKILAGLVSAVVMASVGFAADPSITAWEKIVYGTNLLSASWQFPFTRGIVDRVLVGSPSGDTNTVTMAFVQNGGKFTNSMPAVVTGGAAVVYINAMPAYHLMENGDTLTLTFSHAKTTVMCPYSIWLRDVEK